MKIKFTKMHGTGNDFIIIDNERETINPKHYSKIAKKLCIRRKGIGADGIIFLERDKKYGIKMKYFNKDGSHAPVCGNGGRCVLLYLKEKKFFKNKEIIFTSDGGIHKGMFIKKMPFFQLPSPSRFKEIKIENKKAYYVEVGVPHLVLFFEDITHLDVKTLGRRIRYSKGFKKEGINVNFVEPGGKIKVRTYERGVEDETLSCGTGAGAVAYVLGVLMDKESPIEMLFPGGRLIAVFKKEGKKFYNFFLGGEVELVFEGEIDI